MRIIPADARTLFICLGSSAGRTSVLVIEGNAVVDVIADGLNAGPAGRRRGEQPPGHIGKEIGVAVTAAQKKTKGLFRYLFDRMLLQKEETS